MVVGGRAGVFIVDTKAWPEVAIDGDRITRGQEDVTVAKTWKQVDYDATIRQHAIGDGRPLWSAHTTGCAVKPISVNASPGCRSRCSRTAARGHRKLRVTATAREW